MGNSGTPWYLKRSRRWQPFQDVPWRRLWYFAAAVFFLFSVIGFFNDLMQLGRMPYAIAIAISVACGLNAVLWIVTISRLPGWIFLPLIAFQFFLGPLLDRMASWMAQALSLTEPRPEAGVRFAGACILIVVIVSYVLFVAYFRAESRETGRIRSELELAHGIQKTLVPPILLRSPLFEVYGISRPSDKVGGDLVDALLLPNGDVIAYMADIAGHGLPAGILMGMLKTAARTALLDAENQPATETLPTLLEKLNRVLPTVKEPQMYATLTAFRLNADGSSWYATAASPPVLHWHADGAAPRAVRVIEEKQFPLGLLPVSGFTGSAVDLRSGDLVVVATDGILEVCDQHEQEFGIERLQAAIQENVATPAPQLAEAVLHRVRAFGRQTDDQTLLVIRRVC